MDNSSEWISLVYSSVFCAGNPTGAFAIQNDICRIIYKMCAAHGNMYDVVKAILRKHGVDCGGIRKPLPSMNQEDTAIVEAANAMIEAAISKYC